MKPITGLFLGAGASYEVGMPLVWELTNEIKAWLSLEKLRELNAAWRVQGTGFSDVMIEDFAKISIRSDMHYEALLGYLETQFIRYNTSHRQDYHGLYSWLIEMVYYILYYRQVNNSNFLDRTLPRFDGLRALIDDSMPLWVFSLNHDVMIETIAARLSIPIHTGFSDTKTQLPRRDGRGGKIGEIHAETSTQDQIDNRAMFYPNPLQPGIYLIKIHGALDVFTYNDGKDLLKLLPSDAAKYGHIEALRAANEDLIYLLPGFPNRKAKATNEIAYADDTGEMQFLRRSLLSGAYKFNPRSQQFLPNSMLKHFSSNINFVTNLICIGYGLCDLHINAIIREWLEHSSHRTIEIVNPFIDEVPSFLLHLRPQVILTKSDATDFFDKRAGISRSLLERLEKNVASSLRRRGQARAAQDMNAFAKKNQKIITEMLMKKLGELPQVNGRPDFIGHENIDESAQHWALEAKTGQEEFLAALLKYLEETDGK